MFKRTNVILLVAVFATVWNNCNSQSGDLVGSLTPLAVEQILSILVSGTVHQVGTCSPDTSGSQIQYWLYTQNTPNVPTLVTSFDQINGTKPIVLLLHGWGGFLHVHYIEVIKNAYVPFKDYNIIVVDYGSYVAGDYVSSYCNVPLVGNAVGTWICQLCGSLGVDPHAIHVVGHSLGAHVSGIAGSRAKATCGAIGRITGLDPAGPLFQELTIDGRLDNTDASYVDVVHTNQLQYGYLGNCGSVDFYPNCGYYQKNCLNDTVVSNLQNVQDIQNLPLDLVACSHQRSCYFFAETILLNSFKSSPCIVCGLPDPVCIANPFGAKIYMGEYLRSKPAEQQYYVDAKGQSVYGYGPNGPTNT